MTLSIDLTRFFDFVLVLARTATLIAVMPVFGARYVPAQIKILAAASLSLLIAATIPSSGVTVDAGLLLVLFVAREVIIGLALGVVASLIFHAVEYAGEIAGMQMGFAIAAVFDPQSGRQVPVLSKFQSAVLTLLFLSVGGHMFILRGLIDSFAVLPGGTLELGIGGSITLVRLFGKVFVIALQVAAPATILLLLVNVCLGVIARLVPQMNVFIVGFPLMVMVGVTMVMVSMPAFGGVARHLVEGVLGDMRAVLGAM